MLTGHTAYDRDAPFANPLAPMICLLGPIAIDDGGKRPPLGLRPKALALLARLVLAGAPMQRRELAGLLFSEAADPRGSLRWHLNHLRSGLPESLRACIATKEDTISLDAPCDAKLFALRAPLVANEPNRKDAVEILSLYRGDLCAELLVDASPVYDTWLYTEQERLRREFRLAVMAFARRAFELGEASMAVDPLSRLVTVEPYFEEGHVLYIRALEHASHGQAARAAFRRYERIVRDELRAAPDPELAARYTARPKSRAETYRRLPSDRFVALPELTVHVVEWPGEEPPIIGLHGSGRSAYQLTMLAERIAPDFRFIGMDMRGSGFSDKPPGGYTLWQHADDVAELATALELSRPIVLGFSIGGAVATFAATQVGARGLVLLDGVVGSAAFINNAAALAVEPVASELDLTFGGFDEYLRHWGVEHAIYSAEAEQILEAMVRIDLAPVSGHRVRRRGIRTAVEQTWLSAAQQDTLEVLSKVDCPVLIVQAKQPWIKNRPYLDDEIIEQQIKAARRSQLVVAPASNHPRLVRDPELAVVEGIKTFARGLD